MGLAAKTLFGMSETRTSEIQKVLMEKILRRKVSGTEKPVKKQANRLISYINKGILFYMLLSVANKLFSPIRHLRRFEKSFILFLSGYDNGISWTEPPPSPLSGVGVLLSILAGRLEGNWN